jgi:hypothetical protein
MSGINAMGSREGAKKSGTTKVTKSTNDENISMKQSVAYFFVSLVFFVVNPVLELAV